MKHVNEVLYVYEKAGFPAAIAFIIYRLRLKLNTSKSGIRRSKKKALLMQKINEHLFVYKNKAVKIKGKDLVEFNINNKRIWLRPFTSDRTVFYQIFNREEYKPVIKVFNQFFSQSPKVIFDLGANIGLSSIYFSNLFPDAEILAVEPFKENAEVAEINMSENITNFKLIKGGVWNRNTTLTANRKFRDGKEWSINLQEEEKGNIIGHSLLDLFEQLIPGRSVDILKIDIEGAEKELFENEVYVRNFLKIVRCLAIEIHDEFKCREVIYSRLTFNGFIYFDSGETTIAINKNFIDCNPFIGNR